MTECMALCSQVSLYVAGTYIISTLIDFLSFTYPESYSSMAIAIHHQHNVINKNLKNPMFQNQVKL